MRFRPSLESQASFRTVLPVATARTFCAPRDGPKTSYFLRKMPTNSKVFFVRFMTVRAKKLSAAIIEIHKENWA